MLTRNINNKISFKYNQIPQKKKMQLHKKIFLTLATSLLLSMSHGNISCFAAITQEQAEAFQKIINDKKGKVTFDDIKQSVTDDKLVNSIKAFEKINSNNNAIAKIESNKDRAVRVISVLTSTIRADDSVFSNNEAARIVVDSLLKMYNQNNDSAFNETVEDIKVILKVSSDSSNYNSDDKDQTTTDAISAILKDSYHLADKADKYAPQDDDKKKYSFKNIEQLVCEDYDKLVENMGGAVQKIEQTEDELKKIKDNKDKLTEENDKLKDYVKNLKSEIEKLKAKDPEKSDTKTQAEIKQKEDELKKNEEELKKNQKIIDQQNRSEVIKVQEKLQAVQTPIEAQTYAVQNIAAIQSSIVSNITDTRMNVNQYDIRTSEDENKPVAAGSQTIGGHIKPKSWDIWASGHMGNIRQDAANAISANSKTDFYGGSIGVDKIFANNSVLGLALSYGKSNTEYESKTSTGIAASEKWTSNYYQADIYAHHNFTDSLFVQLIGGIGTYGDGTTIGNMFDFSSQKSTFGYHGNATVGYSIFGGKDSNFSITPKVGITYYHLSIPDSILNKTDSSTFTTLGRLDGIAGLNIKILNLNTNSNSNIKIIPEITAAVKLRLSDNIEGINANNIKLPVVKSTNSNDLSANALAAPETLFTLGGALTVVANNNFSINLNGSLDFATQYLAMVGGVSIKLSF